jgi:hypothetical protein
MPGSAQGFMHFVGVVEIVAGFAVADAARAARDERYDLHALVELVGRGCTPALALRILAPLDEEAT